MLRLSLISLVALFVFSMAKGNGEIEIPTIPPGSFNPEPKIEIPTFPPGGFTPEPKNSFLMPKATLKTMNRFLQCRYTLEKIYLNPGDNLNWYYRGADGVGKCGFRLETDPKANLEITCYAFSLQRKQRLMVVTPEDRTIYNGASGGPVQDRFGSIAKLVLRRFEQNLRFEIECQVTSVIGTDSATTSAPITATRATTKPPSNAAPTTTPTAHTITDPTTVAPTITAAPTATAPVTTTPITKSCRCGQLNPANRIVNGETTIPNEYPYQVGLTWNRNSVSCGGSIIGNRWVLTAAHCTDGESPTDIKVYIGGHRQDSFTSPGRLVNVKRIINHPDYDESTIDNDIALLELDQNLDFDSDSTINPVCLPEIGDTNTYATVNSVVTGWGTTSYGGRLSNLLQKATLPVITNSECQGTRLRPVYGSSITENMLCAYAPNTDACQGDSGGPMVDTNGGTHAVQIGVVSWGSGCATAPGVYARVTRYVQWIENNTGGPGGLNTCPRN